MTGNAHRALRIAGALLLIAVTLTLAKPGEVLERLRALELAWVAVGVALSLPTYALLALRWWYVARRVGAPMRYSRSLADYYLGNFVNQTLPTGLAGSALRVVRHARSPGSNGEPVGYHKALNAVVLERISGLLALGGLALVGALALSRERPVLALYGGSSVLAILLAAAFAFRMAERRAHEGGFVEDTRRALVRDGAIVHNMLMSFATVFMLVAAFYCAAQATGIDLSLGRSFFVAPLILGSMVIPLSIAGWGVREAAAAALFAALGADAATGVAVSVTFGLMSLLASLPGLVVWLLPSSRGQVGGVAQDAKDMIGD